MLVGIVDYGAGNQASVKNAIKKLGFRARLIRLESDLEGVDLLLLPGVGAFRVAMDTIRDLELDETIRSWAYSGRPLLGICLGMQMLADMSFEHGETRGLELIPGEVKQLGKPGWHIGWNRLEASTDSHALLSRYYGDSFYFNHSYEFCTSAKYVRAIARLNHPVVSIVNRDNVWGLQFHPEKSQIAGIQLLRDLMLEMTNA